MSGATNEVGAPETGFAVLTPQADDLYPVLGPVVTARRYPITSCSNVKDRHRAWFSAGVAHLSLES